MLATQLLSDWPAERWQDRRALVGVSGGADSVALLLAMHELAGPAQLTVAHLNHGWRGQESDDDAAFVVKLCADLNRPCVTAVLRDRDSTERSQNDIDRCGDVAMLAKANLREVARIENVDSVSQEKQVEPKTEDAARRARYDFFVETAYQVGASYVLTAHTADDRIETLLHNLLRGAGLAGAASLVMFRSLHEDLVLARPLLKKSRRDIEAFLGSRGQCYRQDSSNLQTHYRRNFLRQEVLPLIAEKYAAAPASLLNFSELAEELQADLDQLADRWLASVGYGQRASGRQTFAAPQTALGAWPWSVIQAALRRVWLDQGWPQADMSRGHWQKLRELCGQSAGVINLPGNLRAELNQGTLSILRVELQVTDKLH